MAREAFLERVWDWKQHYGGVILRQMKRLGASVDWSREYFTMDERMSRAVREAFVRLYEEGLIYRGKYIVNWCPRCITAVSDLEVVHEETPGKIYEIRYPVIGSDEYIVVATTRPETMLGDTAVAVNSGDDRYRHLHGRKVLLPLMNREIPIITDDILANPEFGTGAVKVTPSHDPNDFEAGLRNNLPQIDVMNEVAHMNENAGPYKGLDRFEARQNVLADLQQGGFLVGTKDYIVPLGKCSRCKTIVEPRLSMQWFVKIQPLADRAIEVVENGLIQFVPKTTPRRTSSGCATFTIGVFPGSCGGDIAFRRGIARIARRSRSRARRPANARNAAAAISSRTATCSIPGFRQDCCHAPRWAGLAARRTSTLSTRRLSSSLASTSCSSGWHA